MEIFKNVGDNVGTAANGSSYADMTADYPDGA
jgi:hypothetical protein